jgi:hypothetical protein
MSVVLAVVLVSGIAFGQGQGTWPGPRDTPQRDGLYVQLPAESNRVVWAGTMVAVDSAANAVMASDSTGLVVIGTAQETVNNTLNGGVPLQPWQSGYNNANGNGLLRVRRGAWGWLCPTNAPITRTSIGQICYVLDARTVTTSATTNNIIAGVICDVDTVSGYVYVNTGNIGPQGAATPSSLSVNGNGAFTGTLGVTGASTLHGVTATTLATTGNASLGGTTVAVTNNETVAGTLAVTGAITATAGFVHGTPYHTNSIGGSFTNVYDANGIAVSLNP